MYPPSCSIKIFVPEVTSDTRFLYHQVPVTGIEHEKTISIVRELQTSHHSGYCIMHSFGCIVYYGLAVA